MKTTDITDPVFLKAVEAIDGGDVMQLEALIGAHPYLVSAPLDHRTGDYFDRPYLLWFVADNPIRNKTLPADILSVTDKLAAAVQRYAPATTQRQLDYALGLVVSGNTPAECGVQIAMMDVLIDHGASPSGMLPALAHGHIDAARHLIARGASLDLATAVGLNQMADVKRLLSSAGAGERLIALTVAAFQGNAEMIRHLLAAGIDPNGYPEKGCGFHEHGTPLHQAVSHGSLECVQLLLEAGAKTDALDRVYHASSLGWAMHLQTGDAPESRKVQYQHIENYLLHVG